MISLRSTSRGFEKAYLHRKAAFSFSETAKSPSSPRRIGINYVEFFLSRIFAYLKGF